MASREAWGERAIEAVEYIDLGEYVAVVARVNAVGTVSRAAVSGVEVWLVRFKDGTFVEYRESGTMERALELAGLGTEELAFSRRTWILKRAEEPEGPLLERMGRGERASG